MPSPYDQIRGILENDNINRGTRRWGTASSNPGTIRPERISSPDNGLVFGSGSDGTYGNSIPSYTEVYRDSIYDEFYKKKLENLKKIKLMIQKGEDVSKIHPMLEDGKDTNFDSAQNIIELPDNKYLILPSVDETIDYDVWYKSLRVAYCKVSDNWMTDSSTTLNDDGHYSLSSNGSGSDMPESIRKSLVYSGNLLDIKSPSTDRFTDYDRLWYYNEESIKKIKNIKVEIALLSGVFSRNCLIDFDNGIANNRKHLSLITQMYVSMRNEIHNEVNAWERRNELQTRKPNTLTNTFFSKIKGEYIDSTVPFAVELEMYGKDQSIVAQMSKAISKEWGVTKDGSLSSGIGYPIEIQSPILMGKKGEQSIIDTCDILNEMGFMVDNTCGMHLHMDGGTAFVRSPLIRQGKEKPVNLISLYLFHRLFEDVIVSFLPTTRRVNHYCSQFKNGAEYQGSAISFNTIDDSFKKMLSIKTLRDFELYWYKVGNDRDIDYCKNQRYTVSRYMGINFHSLLKDNHIEVRYHSGTKNYEKILYWADLHCKIIQLCASGVINQKMLTEIKNKKLNLDKLTKEMFNILGLKKDTVEYLMDRHEKFINADTKNCEEILIDKTKKVGVE